MKKWWKEHWYGALLALILGGIVLITWGAGVINDKPMEGILVKTDSGVLYLLRVEESYDEWGVIFLKSGEEQTINQETLNTGDRVEFKGRRSTEDILPVKYRDVKQIRVIQKYDEESVQIVKDAMQRFAYGGLWYGGQPVYPE